MIVGAGGGAGGGSGSQDARNSPIASKKPMAEDGRLMRNRFSWESPDMAPLMAPEPKTTEPISTGTLTPGLYITATPIGNAADITLRALTVLRKCDAIVAEDTRVTARLLALHGISRPLLIYNEHNAAAVEAKLLQRLRSGERLALVGDAGTPLISDPGLRLVKSARDEGLPVFPVPGPSAVIAALSAAGLPTTPFLFAGFLPARQGERRTVLQDLRRVAATLVFFESPQRLCESLSDMLEILGDRQACVAREITKLHEDMRCGSLSQLEAHYSTNRPRGEIVVIVAPGEVEGPDPALVDSLLRQALPFMPVKAAASLVAKATGAGRRAVYDRALALAGKGRDAGE
jgi:16S rRNA (cytidine1402-2'-O)-methyltransferase